MSDAKVRGTVHLIEETKTYGQKGFRKRVVVLEQEKGSFTNYVPLEFTRDACDAVDQLQLGDEIEVDYFLNGRKWQRDADSEVKYFLNAEATGFKLVGGGDRSAAAPKSSRRSPNDAFSESAEDDDAPF